jgi:hypothetical protein
MDHTAARTATARREHKGKDSCLSQSNEFYTYIDSIIFAIE